MVLFFDSLWGWIGSLFNLINFEIITLSDGTVVNFLEVVLFVSVLYLILKFLMFRH